jgi:hypothetical protein
MLKFLLSLGIVVAAAESISAAELTPDQQKFFESEVRPLLAEKCQKCHGSHEQNGSLRLDGLKPMLSGGDSGPAVVPGHPEKSLLVKAVSYNDTTVQMPPDGKLPDEKVAVLTRWIQMGAPWPQLAEEGPLAPRKEFKITDEDRKHWSFQPMRRPELKGSGFGVHGSGQAIDALVLGRLKAKGLSLSSPADRRELIRRAYFDLLGLPPSPEEVDAFVADESANAYEHLIDRLLESPQYGERWARHWLDLVRFGQTNGYEFDEEKREAWRYRDYVIRALNEDKPYDRFVLEQIAGDELPDATPDSIIATGFYRLGVWDKEPDDKQVALVEEYDDMVRTAGETFLGLTIGCARCHDHKFDPISQEDYYRMTACFRGIKPTGNNPTEPAHWRFDPDAVYTPLTGADDLAKWRAVQRKAERVRNGGGSPGQALDRANRLIENFKRSATKSLSAREGSEGPPPTHVLVRGNPHTPAAEVPPGTLKVLDPMLPAADFTPPTRQAWNDYRRELAEWGVVETSGRRLALARWITDPRNPLSARVIVNRLWQHHFGRGIVPTPSDFGRTGQPPTNIELLDYLASELIAGGWRLKALHKQIMLSETYRQSSRIDSDAGVSIDPDNALCWRQNAQRMDAESLRDSILAVSGRLNLRMGGRGIFPKLAAEVLATQSRPGSGWDDSSPEEESRRSIYIYAKRTLRVPLMESLDQPSSESHAAARPTTTIAPQALMLLNSTFIDEQSAAFAQRLERECGSEPSAQIERAYRLALGRKPSEDEMAMLRLFIERQRAAWATDEITKDSAAQKALAAVCKLVLNLNEFAYVD